MIWVKWTASMPSLQYTPRRDAISTSRVRLAYPYLKVKLHYAVPTKVAIGMRYIAPAKILTTNPPR